MLISTRGRYALRVMVDLAEHRSEGYIPLKAIADRQEISEKYLESIVVLLVKAKMLDGVRGKGGGYRLSRAPEDYTLGEILRAAEGTLAPVTCLDCSSGELCPRAGECATLPVWRDLGAVTSQFLDSKRLSDILEDGEAGPCA